MCWAQIATGVSQPEESGYDGCGQKIIALWPTVYPDRVAMFIILYGNK